MKHVIITLVILLTCTLSANAQYIVDTGPGLNNRGGNSLYNTSPWNGDYQFLAVEFSLNETYSLTGLEGWIYHDDSLNEPSNIDFVIYGDAGNIPDVNNELYSQVVSISANYYPTWHGLTDLDWQLSSGNYWLAFEVRQPALNSNAMPEGAPNPLLYEAYNNGGNGSYLSGSVQIGVRIQGTPVVPEPVSSTLFIIGGATLGFRRFRKTFKK